MSSGQTASVRVALAVGGVTEQVQVTVESPIVDATSATTGQDITLQLTESLPTGRSYQSYLQLVPGVLPDDPQKPGNPASKSGINYSDIGGDARRVERQPLLLQRHQRDRPGRRDVWFQPEHRDHPGAEGADRRYSGGVRRHAGLLSTVITKSGTNVYPRLGQLLLPEQRPRRREHELGNAGVLDLRRAVTIGGPIVRDRAWFFGSYRRIEREDDVTTPRHRRSSCGR